MNAAIDSVAVAFVDQDYTGQEVAEAARGIGFYKILENRSFSQRTAKAVSSVPGHFYMKINRPL